MMELYVYGIVYTILYVILCKMFIEIFARKRFQNANKNFFLTLVFVLLECMVSVFFSEQVVFKQVVIIVFGVFFSCYFFQLKLWKGFFLFLLYQGLCFATDYGLLITSQNVIPNTSANNLASSTMSLLMGTVSQMLVFCVILILRGYFENENLDILTKFEWARFSVFPIFSIISIIAIFVNFGEITGVKQKNILLCIAFGMLSMNILVFYLIYGILVREIQINENKIFLERAKSETEIYRQVSRNYENQRKREHEYKNEMMLISSLIGLKEYEKVKSVIEEFSNNSFCRINCIDTNNIIINAILNAKYEETREKDILFVLKFNDLSGLNIKDRDIVIILSNLLNNAIVASEKCKDGDKIVKIKIWEDDTSVVISVINTYLIPPIFVDGKYKTIKKDKSSHGIGIENIKDTINKYNGTCAIRYDDKYFYFVIFIPK